MSEKARQKHRELRLMAVIAYNNNHNPAEQNRIKKALFKVTAILRKAEQTRADGEP